MKDIKMPDFDLVSKAVASTEGVGDGLKDKKLDKYVEENWKRFKASVQDSYKEFNDKQNKPLTIYS